MGKLWWNFSLDFWIVWKVWRNEGVKSEEIHGEDDTRVLEFRLSTQLLALASIDEI